MHLRAGVVAIFALLTSGCVSTTGTVSGGQPPRPQHSKLTLDQLLRLPIEQGHSGIDEAIRQAHLWYGLAANAPITMADTKEPVLLADGSRLSNLRATFLPESGWKSFGGTIELTPCYTVERAVRITGARTGSDPLHGDVYDVYAIRTADVIVNMSAPGPDKRCIGSMSFIKRYPMHQSPQ